MEIIKKMDESYYFRKTKNYLKSIRIKNVLN